MMIAGRRAGVLSLKFAVDLGSGTPDNKSWEAAA